MWGSLEKFSISQQIGPMTIYDEYYRTAALARCVDDRALRSDELFIAWKDHGSSWLTEVIEHIDHKHGGSLRLKPEGGFDFMVYRKGVSAHIVLSRAGGRPMSER